MQKLYGPTQIQCEDKTAISDYRFTCDSSILFVVAFKQWLGTILITSKTAVLTLAAWVHDSYGFHFHGHLVIGSEHYTVKWTTSSTYTITAVL